MLTKGLDVLQHFAARPHGDTASGVARELGLPLSTAHRLVSTLAKRGWLTRTDMTYRMGLQALGAAGAVFEGRRLTDLHGAIADLSARLRETVILGTLTGEEFVYVDVVHGPGLLGVKGSVSQRGPLHCTAVGKGVLTALPRERREELMGRLEMPRFTKRTITDVESLRREIDRGVERGYTLADEEYEVGVVSIGTPLRLINDPDGAYAMCVSVPAQRANPERRAEFKAALEDTVATMQTAGVVAR
ncbi:IclR family transcriptional regulator [Bogoriella caseilytica]|uniref:IclR family transcriptional regulator n=1 Tax=Bogoriella caseilytica TaxID=56055 RepID=A0A3N2BD29_9MICO|nr:IclR family transcriptional regulator [Bogoriella caseilytica]ROR73157.1 IclR family transcriptional regulator [Bogoriella caseilytica]